jgi:hypothetical protein
MIERVARDQAKVVLWTLGLWGGVQLAGLIFARSESGGLAVAAVIAELGAGTVGIAWSDPLAPVPSWTAIARRAAIGAGLGVTMAVLTVVVGLAARTAVVVAGPTAVATLALGLGLAALGAVRDELLLRGMVLRATRSLPAWVGLLVCGAAAAAARFGLDGAPTLAMAADAARGVAFGALWRRDRGAWMPWGANTAWAWAAGPGSHGGLVDVRFAAEPVADAPTLALLGTAALAASIWALRDHGPKK